MKSKEDYIEELRQEFYSNQDFKDCEKCMTSVKSPLYSELKFGYIWGRKKSMHVYDELLNERYLF